MNYEPASLAEGRETLGTKLKMSTYVCQLCVSIATHFSLKTPMAAVRSGENGLINVSPRVAAREQT